MDDRLLPSGLNSFEVGAHVLPRTAFIPQAKPATKNATSSQKTLKEGGATGKELFFTEHGKLLSDAGSVLNVLGFDGH